MEQAYQYLLSVEFRHEYFKDGQFKSIQVSFDEETTRLIKNLDIILKPFPGGVHFLALNPELLNDTTLNTPIRIFLACNDPYYINYSELPEYSPSDTVMYFNNLVSLPNTEETVRRLHHKDFVGENNFAQLSLGKLAISNFDSAKVYHFEDVFGNDVSEYIRPSQNELNGFLISNRSQGIIRVFANGQEEERVYYYPKSVWEKPLGIVELYLETLFEQYDQNEKQTYILNFQTRKTIWKYFLVDPVYQQFEKLEIIKGNDERSFYPPIEQEVSGHNALVFVSKEPLPLLEYSSDVPLKLINGEEGTSIDVIKHLPWASPEQLFRVDENNTDMYSHIYL